MDLGPTFVKLGQIASTRSDIYPPAFTAELESLQDNVPPVDFDTIASIVNMDLFSQFEKQPFKSASIGQVHRATLKSGEDVIVKVKISSSSTIVVVVSGGRGGVSKLQR